MNGGQLLIIVMMEWLFVATMIAIGHRIYVSTRLKLLRLREGDFLIVSDWETANCLMQHASPGQFTVPIIIAPNGIETARKQDLEKALQNFKGEE